MIEINSVVQLTGVSGNTVMNFFLHCNDNQYQNWWTGTHLAWHTKKRLANHVGSIIYFDEYVGRRRLKFDAVVTQFSEGKEIAWQMKKFIRLPVWLVIRFTDCEAGTTLTHTLKAGFPGFGRLFDGFFRFFFFTKQFEKDMDEHAHIEFQKLAEILA